jgi:uncharacterized protein VirK/YbjX
MYKILPYTHRAAKKLGLQVKPSRKPLKKIDVFTRSGEFIASIGARGYKDYPTYLKLEKAGKVKPGTAATKRRSFKKRFAKARKVKLSKAWLADRLLW